MRVGTFVKHPTLGHGRVESLIARAIGKPVKAHVVFRAVRHVCWIEDLTVGDAMPEPKAPAREPFVPQVVA